MIHVALLRGINVGGGSKVPMADLRALCNDLGWTDVATYINSGNVVFSAPSPHAAALEEALEATFGFRPRVLVKTAAQVLAIAGAIPSDWSNGPEMRADVVYLFDKVSSDAALAELAPREGIDTAIAVPGAVLWMVRREDVTRNGLYRWLKSPLYQQSTVRNINTARRLAAMVQ